MAGVLLTEMSMVCTSEDLTLSPGYEAYNCQSILSGTQRNEMSNFFRGMSGSVAQVAESISRNKSNSCQNSYKYI